MAQPFAYTLRSLEKDNGRVAATALGVLLLLAVGWLVWMLKARITVYEVSTKTRLEVHGSAYSIHSAVAGKIAAIEVKLGQKVEKGQLLVRLDSAVEEQRLATSRARLEALDPQIAVTASELKATRGAVIAEVAAGSAAMRQAKARSKEADIKTQLAERESSRYKKLGDAVSVQESDRVVASAQMSKAAHDAMLLDVRRLRSEQRLRQRSGEAKVATLRRELATLQGERQALLATVAELHQIIERHAVRAPGDGVVGELQPLQIGAYVTEGAKLASVLPNGELVLIAEFEPSSALGRVRPGQSGEFRLAGFPWLEYGTVKVRVIQCASEVRNGTVRVELLITEGQKSLVPFQHGLPGTVEVAVEQVSPLELLLRSLGRRLDGNAGTGVTDDAHEKSPG